MKYLTLLIVILSIVLVIARPYREQEGENRQDMRAVSSNVDLDEDSPYAEEERLLRVLHHVGGFTAVRNTFGG